MKKMATITGENGKEVTISFETESNMLYTESLDEPTTQVGPQFASEEQAAEYIQDSWGGNWNLNWAN
jgi:hypothetical protein